MPVNTTRNKLLHLGPRNFRQIYCRTAGELEQQEDKMDFGVWSRRGDIAKVPKAGGGDRHSSPRHNSALAEHLAQQPLPIEDVVLIEPVQQRAFKMVDQSDSLAALCLDHIPKHITFYKPSIYILH